MLFDSTLLGSYELSVVFKIMMAVLAGGIIGLEREKHGRPAGLRTHLLVAAGSCLMMIVSEAFSSSMEIFPAAVLCALIRAGPQPRLLPVSVFSALELLSKRVSSFAV